MPNEVRHQQIAAILARGLSRIPLNKQPVSMTKRAVTLPPAKRIGAAADQHDDSHRFAALTSGEQ